MAEPLEKPKFNPFRLSPLTTSYVPAQCKPICMALVVFLIQFLMFHREFVRIRIRIESKLKFE